MQKAKAFLKAALKAAQSLLSNSPWVTLKILL